MERHFTAQCGECGHIERLVCDLDAGAATLTLAEGLIRAGCRRCRSDEVAVTVGGSALTDEDLVELEDF